MINLSVRDFKLKKDFLVYDLGKIELVFSTAEEDRSFNRNTEYGINNLSSIIKDFNLSDVVYLNQIHSDKIYTYNKDYINIKDNNIIIDLAKINSEAILYNTSISDVYIKDKALYIIGTNLDMYLNA